MQNKPVETLVLFVTLLPAQSCLMAHLSNRPVVGTLLRLTLAILTTKLPTALKTPQICKPPCGGYSQPILGAGEAQ